MVGSSSDRVIAGENERRGNMSAPTGSSRPDGRSDMDRGRGGEGKEGKGRENGIGNRAATREAQISPIGGSRANRNGGLNLPRS